MSVQIPDDDDITVDGTIKLCEDLGVDPEDVVLLAVAFGAQVTHDGPLDTSRLD